MGPRVFTPREANRLIPEVESTFAALDSVRDKLKRIKGKLDVLEMIWGDEVRSETNPDRREYDHYVADLDRIKTEFDTATAKFADMGVQIKSLESGLVDFYGIIDKHIVFLCWKRGEKSVEWYHHVEDGFPGRQKIPAEELAP